MSNGQLQVKIGPGGKELQITVPLSENKRSRTGKSTIVASSGGNYPIGKINGKPTFLQLNVMQSESDFTGSAIGPNVGKVVVMSKRSDGDARRGKVTRPRRAAAESAAS